jgi:hypothetical protein
MGLLYHRPIRYIVLHSFKILFADIRNNMFTADKNWIQARIADKTADTSLKLLKLIPVFYCFDKSVV